MLLDLAAVFLLSCAAGCGVGGGGLLVVYLTLVLGMPQLTSQATNLLLYISASASSSILLWKRRALPPPRLILLCTVCALPGVFLGTYLRGFFPEPALKIFFGCVLIIAGLSVLLGEARRSVRLLSERKKSARNLISKD